MYVSFVLTSVSFMLEPILGRKTRVWCARGDCSLLPPNFSDTCFGQVVGTRLVIEAETSLTVRTSTMRTRMLATVAQARFHGSTNSQSLLRDGSKQKNMGACFCYQLAACQAQVPLLIICLSRCVPSLVGRFRSGLPYIPTLLTDDLCAVSDESMSDG